LFRFIHFSDARQVVINVWKIKVLKKNLSGMLMITNFNQNKMSATLIFIVFDRNNEMLQYGIFLIENQHNTIFAIVLYSLQWNFKACFDIHSIPETFQAKSNFQIKQTNITKTPSTTCSSFSAPLKKF
jgi:hypothetical protein